MSVYLQKESKNYWIKLWDGRDKKHIRVSSGTDDREKAEKGQEISGLGNKVRCEKSHSETFR